MRTKILFIIPFVLLALSACTVVDYQRTKTHQATQLETREFQTRTFDTNDTKLIMKALVNVLQDDNYIITNAVTDLGVIMAKKEIDLGRSAITTPNDETNFWIAFFEALNKKGQPKQPVERTFQKTKIVEVSINVTEFGSKCKVRANFQAKVLDNKGDVVEVYPVQDGRFYQDFFAKVDKAIFLQKHGL